MNWDNVTEWDVPARVIAQQVGCSENCAWREKKSRGAKMMQRGGKEGQGARIDLDAIHWGDIDNKIARDHGCSRERVRQLRKEYTNTKSDYRQVVFDDGTPWDDLELDLKYPQYPCISRLDVEIQMLPVQHIRREELRGALDREGIADKFDEFYGVQTCYVDGPFPWDVEAVLTRIWHGRLEGTQRYWD